MKKLYPINLNGLPNTNYLPGKMLNGAAAQHSRRDLHALKSPNRKVNIIPNQITMQNLSVSTDENDLFSMSTASNNAFKMRLLLFMFFICLFSGLNAQYTFTSNAAGNWNTASNWTRTGPGPGAGTIPGSNPDDIVVINHAMILNASPTNALSSLTINATTGSLNLSSSNITVSGATTINGSLTDNSTTGANTFNGLFTVSSTGSFSTSNNPPFIFGGGITNNGTFSKGGSGTVTFNGPGTLTGTFGTIAGNTTISGATIFASSSSATFSGTVAVNAATTINSLASITLNGTTTIANNITVTNNGTANITGALTGATSATNATWVNAANSVLNYSNAAAPMNIGILDASASPNTVNYNGTDQNVKGANYNILNFTGTTPNTKTLIGTVVVATAFTVPASITFNLAGGTFTANNTTTVNGTLQDGTIAGTNTFNGLFTVASTGNFTISPSTVTSPVIFGGGISNEGIFSKTGTGAVTFNNTSTIGGTSAITLAGAVTFNGSTTISNSAGINITGTDVTIAAGVTVTNQGTVSITGNLNGGNASSAWVNDNNSTLNYNGVNQPMATGILNVAGLLNTVNYNRSGNQTVRAADYKMLSITGGSTKTLSGVTTVADNLTVNASVTLALAANNLTVNGITTLNGTLTHTSGIFTFNNNLNIGSTGSLTLSHAVNIPASATVTNLGTANLNGTLNGSDAGSAWVNGANATLNYAGANLMSTGSFDASAAGNTVNYTGASQNIRLNEYHHISFSGSGTKTIAGDLTINGNFNRTGGTLSLNPGQTITFASSSLATFTPTAFQNVVINKIGGTLTCTASGTSFQNLTISNGSLNLGAVNTTVTVNGDLSGSGIIDMSGATHTLNLNGLNNAIGSITHNTNAVPTGTINYVRNGTQTILATEYRNLTFTNTGVAKSLFLSGNIGVRGALNFSGDALVMLGQFDIKIRTTGSLTSTAAFSANRMFVTDGSGMLFKEGAAVTDFTTSMYTTGGGGWFPVGNSGGLFTPFRITSLTASVTGTAFISARAVPERQPNIPYFNNALIKYWDIQTTNISGINANLSFQYNASEVIGSSTAYTPRLWNGTTLSTPAGSASATPFVLTAMNTIAGQWSAADPTFRTAIYSYQSGDWNNPNTWTTDPSGSTLVSPVVPGASDQVFILNGKTITAATAGTAGQLEIQSGGVLDIGSTTGHNLGNVSGEGTLRLSTVTFPGGTYTGFTAADGGTIEYYNLPAATNLSATQTTYNNLQFTNSTASSFTATIASNLTLNGSLSLSRSAAGTVIFTLPNAGPFSVEVRKDVTIGSGCTWNIEAAAGNLQHTVDMHGNLTNNGTLDFQNGAAYTATSGRAILTFRGTGFNTTATFNAGSTTDFFQVVLTKNEGYELYMSASPSATVNFNGSDFTINPTLGTLRLGPNLNVARLINTGNNYDIGTSGTFPVLWIDGATVSFGGTGGAIVPYGILRITAGTLNVLTGQRSVVLRESGLFQIDGGTVNMGLFRTSTNPGTHRGAFIMTGGILNIDGNSNHQDFYSYFSLPYAENAFKMSGGVINITRTASGGITPHGGIMIACSPQNFDVSGGTFNVKTTGNFNFDITSTAPFYNLNLGRNTAGTGTIRLNAITWNTCNCAPGFTIPAQPLTVLNDLVIESSLSPAFDAMDNNINVNGNFTVSAGSTLTTGSNTIAFDGNTAQSFNVSGTVSSPGLGGITVNKGAASILTLSGTAASLTATGNLNLLAGVLNDNGKTLFVAGNVTNNSTHTGTGRISLNGTTQTIAGNGTGQFQNLEVSGASGTITASNHINVNGNLNFSANRILNISIYRLNLPGSATITSTSGSFSSSRFITTDGFQSDGGIVKTFNSTSPFLFPFGTGTNYTPATIQFSATPGSWGTLDVRPVTARQLYVTDPNTFVYYWKVRGIGFSGIPANSINHTFNYGSLPDNTSYIPGYYNYQSIAFTPINDVNKVDEVTNNILFTGVSYFNGDFTAGVPAAFGIVVPYYSRTNGNWNSPSTWSNTGFGGAVSATIPTANTPVFIGDGNTFNHTVTVTANNTYSGSLIIDAGSTLNLGTTTGHNFGALPYSTAGGAGTLRISSAAATAEFPAGDFGVFFTNEGGTTEYYGTGAQTFTLPIVTASPTSAQIRTYKNLVLNPGPGGTISLPDRDLEIYQNISVSGSGISALNDVTSKTLTVNGNVEINGGDLRFMSNSSQQLNIKGNLNVNAGSILDVANSGAITHNIDLEGNLTNNGTIDLNEASVVNITFSGNANRFITGTNASASTSFNRLRLNKGNSKVLSLELNVAGSLSAPSNDWLTLSNGTFIFNKAATITLNNLAISEFFIPETAGLTVNNAGAVINASAVSSHTADLILAGRLQVSAGTMNIGPVGPNTHNDIEYSAAAIAELIVEGSGVLNVNGQIRRSDNALLGSLSYTQRNNSTVLVRGRNNSGGVALQRAKFEILNQGSSFTMQDNALLIIDRSGNPSGIFGDFYLDPQFANITGGEIRFGTGNTPVSQTFTINATTALWNLSVDGTTTSKTVSLLNNPITVQRNLTIAGSSEFNAAGYNVTIGGNLINNNPIGTKGNTTVTFGGFLAGTTAGQIASQVTTFNGSISQTITGAGGNLTNFSNVVVNNTSAGGLNLGSNANVAVSGTLTVTNGNINGGNNNMTVDGDIESSANINNTGSGFFICGSATSAIQTISGNGSGTFGNFRVNNPAGINMMAPYTINGVMDFSSGQFYINNHQLTLGTSATVTGSFNPGRMIRVNGVTSDGGVRKMFPASAQSFTFPIGLTLKYTPATINVTSNSTAGSVTIKPVNTKHPATTDPLSKELTYYWNTTSTGFSPATTVSHTYTYMDNDALNGTENLYRAGRYMNNIWTPQFGIPSTVNAASNTINISGVNYFDGDFTAGESSEFDLLTVFYSRNATSGGNWNDPNAWSTDQVLQHAGPAAVTFPSSNSVVIAAGHTITVTANGVIAPTAEINGTLNLQNFNGHDLGTVTGTGKLRMTPNASNQFVFAGGNFAAFVNTGGGTVEYSSNVTALLPTQGTYNNLQFSGSGNKQLANADLLVNANFDIQAGNVVNVSNKNINLKGDFINLTGVSGFQQGTGTLTLSGAAQSITGATQFYRLQVNGAGVKTLNNSIDVTNLLTLSNGVIATGGNQLNILVTGNVSGGSATSYVFGNLRKFIATATISKTFEIGDNARYAPVTLTFTGTTNNSGSILASTASGDHPNIGTSGLAPNKSVNRYWMLTNSGVGGFTSYSALFNFNAADLDPGANTANFIFKRFATGVFTTPTVGAKTATSAQATGLTAFGDFIIAEEFTGGITWNGSISADWNLPANWTPNFVPGAGDDITIEVGTFQPSFLTAGNGNCNNIVFQSGASLTVPTGYTLNVNGNWTGVNTNVNGPGTVRFTSGDAQHNGTTTFKGIVVVASGANLTTGDGITMASGANLMHGTGTPGAGGSITGQVKVQRQGATGNNYNYWSSPITNSSISAISASNRYRYSPINATGNSIEGLRSGWTETRTGNMTVGRGYISTGTGLATFNGTVNNGNLNFGPLVQGAHTSFNLVGNPYPSNISASALVAANPHLSGGAIYLWDDDGTAGADYNFNDYITWNGIGQVGPNTGKPFNGTIAAGQGLFVNASNTNPIVFTNSMRTAADATFFEDGGVERLWISVTTGQNDYNETLIGFKEDASDGFDNKYDATKMLANEKIGLYSMIGADKYVIQGMASLTADKTIQLGLDASVNGQQTFRLKKTDNLDETVQIILEDTKTGVFQNLRSNPVYQYQYNKSTDHLRFRLHFKPAVEIQASTESCVENDGAITINSRSATSCNVTVRNEAGELIAEKKNLSGLFNITGLASGIYQVSLINSLDMDVKKAIEIRGGTPVQASISAGTTNAVAAKDLVDFAASVEGTYTDITWNFGDGSTVSGTLTPVHMFTEPGIFTVTFIASNANCMDVQQMQISVSANVTGIADVQNATFSVYPNPVSSGSTTLNLNLKQMEPELLLHLIDAAGRIVKTQRIARTEGSVQVQLEVADLANGVYQLLVQGKNFSTAAKITIAK